MSIVEKIKLHYPLPIAKLHEEMRLETVPLLRIYKLINLFEGTVQYMVLVGMSYYRHQQMSDADIEQLRGGLNRPSLGHWVKLLRGLSRCLRPSDPHFLTADPMHDYKDEPIGAAVAILREVLGMETLKKVNLHHFLDTMVEFRNKKRGHGELPTPEAEKIRQPLEAALNQWLDELSPLYDRHLLYLAEIHMVQRQPVCTGTHLNTGTSPDAYESEGVADLFDKRVYHYQPGTNTYISLWPFMVYDPDSQVLYTYHELTDQGAPHLRRIYNVRGTNEWLTIDADKSVVLGGEATTQIKPSLESDRPNVLRGEPSVESNVQSAEAQDHSDAAAPFPASDPLRVPNRGTQATSETVKTSQDHKVPTSTSSNPIGNIRSEQSSEERERLQKRRNGLKPIWDELQERIDDLWKESVNEPRVEEKSRLKAQITKLEKDRDQIDSELRSIEVQLEKLEPVPQREIQKLKHQSEVRQSGVGLSTVAEMLQNRHQQIQAVIARSGDKFEHAHKQIDIMQDYKNIHDALHELEFKCFKSIAQQLPHFPQKVNFSELNFYLLTLSQIRKRIQDIVSRAALPQSENPLLSRLEDAEQTLTQALKNRNRELFDKAVRGVAHILKYDLSRINQRLSNAAASLSLPNLIDSMEQVRSYLVNYEDNPSETNAIEQGIQSLRNLDNSLSTKTREHSEWQEINDELRLAESDLQSAIDQWPHLKERLHVLCGKSMDTLVLPIREVCNELDQALHANETKRKLKELFRSLNGFVGLRFQEIDTYLKDFYDDVRVLDEPLTSIVRQIMR